MHIWNVLWFIDFRRRFKFPTWLIYRVDHLSNTKRGGVCIYYKESLNVWALNLRNLNECIICEVSVKSCIGFIDVIDRSPSQSTSEFEEFLSNIEEFWILLHHPVLSLL